MGVYDVDNVSPATSAYVDFVISDNVTWTDALQFGTPGDTSWSFTGQNFRLDIKGNKDQTIPLLSITSSVGQIVVDDPVQRVLHFLVPEAALNAGLVPGHYVYDLIMFDNSVPPIRIQLCQGKFHFGVGVTGG